MLFLTLPFSIHPSAIFTMYTQTDTHTHMRHTHTVPLDFPADRKPLAMFLYMSV